jgi:HEAT repeat protein
MVTAALICGCSKREAEHGSAPPESAAPATNAAAPSRTAVNPPTTSAPVTSISRLPSNLPAQPLPQPNPSTPQSLQAVSSLESDYRSNTDFSSRVDVVYKLSDIGTSEALATLGRLFHLETDNDLRVEILDSLFDIDGLDDKKIAILAAGAGADQVKDVREAAIDGLTDVDPQRAIPILQALLSDPDEEIRDAAKDAIEQLQTQMTQTR